MRTQSILDTIVHRLQQNCGDDLEACAYTGVSLIFLEQWCKDDAKVAEAIAEARRVGTQGLFSAAIRRGVYGVEEDVYYKGMVVGTKKNYSDSLLMGLLKAKIPDFNKDGDASRIAVNVNVANVMPRAENYEQWLAMKQQTLAPPKAEEEVIEAEYEEVPARVSVLPDIL